MADSTGKKEQKDEPMEETSPISPFKTNACINEMEIPRSESSTNMGTVENNDTIVNEPMEASTNEELTTSLGEKEDNKEEKKEAMEESSLTNSEEINEAKHKSENINKHKNKKKEKSKTVNEFVGEASSINEKPTSESHENKLTNSVENVTKRLKSQECKKSSLNKSDDSDSDEDSSKRQKLNECQETNSITNSSQESNAQQSNFRKLKAKYKKRNYRSQSNSSDHSDETNEPVRQSEETHEESSSSESIEFQPDEREDFVNSSDERSEVPEDNGDSNEWTTASEDSIDEIPAVLQKEPSKSDWAIVKDVINRQIGSNNTIPSRFYSSLHAVQRLELMYKLEEHLGCVNALGFNQKGNLLASASDDLTITIWDWAIGKKRVALQTGHRSNVFQSKWLPLDMECFVVSCARDGQVRLIDVKTSVTRKLAQHRAACHKISTHLDLPHIVLSAAEDSKVLSIDVRENKPTKLLSVIDNDQEVDLYSIHSNPLNNYEFCVAGRTRSVKIYDRRKPLAPLHQLCPKHLLSDELAHVTCAVYNHNGTEIVASYNSEDIYLFDTVTPYQSGDYAHKYQGHRNSVTVKGVNFFGPNSEFILSGSDCGNIFIWDKKTEAIVQWMPGDEQGIVNALEPHPHIPILATSGLDYDVKIWIPSREDNPNIKQQLQACVKNNLAARAKIIGENESAFDSHVLWIMLTHIRRAERQRQLVARRARNQDVSGDDSDIDDDDDGEDDDFNDDDDDNDDVNSSSSNDNSTDRDDSES